MTDKLAVLSDVEKRLASITRVDEAKAIRDQAEAIRIYAKSARKGLPIQNRAALIKILAERRAGELLKRIAREQGKRNGGTTLRNTLLRSELDKMTARRWQILARVSEEKIRRLEAEYNDIRRELTSAELYTTEERDTKEGTRAARRNANQEKVIATTAIDPPLEHAYATIVLDPPWDFSDEGDVDPAGARPDYATLTIDELHLYPVAQYADVDCHCYLWITNRSLPKGFALLETWGFRYVTCLTWCKPSIGLGSYFRGSTEQILFAVKGSLPLARNDVGTWFAAPRGAQHSSKPLEFYTLVESCSPGPYLDLFGRGQRAGWKVWPDAS